MKTRNFILSFLMMMFCSVTFGQSNGWGDVNPYQYPGSMTVVTYISVDDVIQTATNLELGAFCGNEMRGKASLKKVGQGTNERHLAYITIYGGKVGNDGNDVADDETISFKLYDKTAGKVIFPAAIETIAFANNKVVGTTAEPTTINFKSAAKIGDVKYPTLADAFAAATEGQTVVMLRNVTEDFAINNTAAVTFDMAGKTLTGAIMPSTANLTVKNGTIVNNNTSYSAIEINSGSIVLNEDVKVSSVRHAIRIDGAVAATIKGGEYTLIPKSGRTHHALNVSGAANVTIEGGKFVGPKGTASESGSAVNVQSGATVTISGGEFSGGKRNTLASSGTAALLLKGGKYHQGYPEQGDQFKQYCAPGYMTVKDGDWYTVVEAVAKIDEKYYATLQSAFAAAQAGETVVMLRNVTEDFAINNTAAVTFDMAGKTLTGAIMPSTANLTVKNGTIVNNNTSYSAIEINSGSIVLNEDVKVSSVRHAIRIDGAVAATIKGGEYTLIPKSGRTHHALNVSGAANVTIEGGKFVGPKGTASESGSAVNVQSGATVTISGGEFSGGKRNTLASSGTLSLTGGRYDQDVKAFCAEGYMTVKDGDWYEVVEAVAKIGEKYYATLQSAFAAAQAGETVVMLRNVTEDFAINNTAAVTFDMAGKTLTGAIMPSTANLTVKNGTIVNNNTSYSAIEINSGSIVLNEDVKVSSVRHAIRIDGAVAATIKGGEYTLIPKSGRTHHALNVSGAANVTIEGGKFVGPKGTASDSGSAIKVQTGATVAISGGEFSGGKTKTLSSDGTLSLTGGRYDQDVQKYCAEGYMTVKGTDGWYTVVKAIAKIEQTGKIYATLSEAFAAATEGQTVVMLSNAEEVVNINKEAAVTLNMAGFTLTGSILAPSANLTVANGTIINNDKNVSAIEIKAGTLTLETTVTVESARHALRIDGAVVATVNGGTYKSAQGTGTGTYHAANISGAANVTIKGGTFVGPKGTTADSGSAVNVQSGAAVTIEGGEFSGGKRNTLASSGTLSLTGGRYDQDVNGFCADGYMAVKGADGWYTVVANMVKVLDVANNEVGTYASIAEALAEAQAGYTLTFLADITEDATISKAVTIDGAGKTYTGKMTVKADLTIKNVNFDGKGYNGYAVETRGAQYLTIEDCTAKNYGYGFVQLASATVLTTVKNVTVSSMNYGVKVDYSGAVVLENVDITAGVAALLNSNYGEKTITIKDSKLNILGTWVRNNTIKTTYVFEGANTVGQWIIDAAIDNFKLATVESTLTAPNEVTVTTDLAGYTVKYADGKYYVAANMVKVLDVANNEVGTYASIAEALAEAQAGYTLTFLADITEDATISKAVTIDGAGKTYTGKMTVKADLTIKNVNFDGKGYNGYAVETRGAQYLTIEDCTAKNYGYGFVQLASATVLTTVKNVTVSSMNYGVKVDYSGAVVLENVDITAGVAALLNSNYGEKTITIKDSKLNILGTWVRNNTIKTTYVFEGANTVGQWIIDAAIDNFKLATVESTLTAPNEVTVTTDLAGYTVKYADGKYYVAANMVKVLDVANNEVGTYASIAEALAAAQAGYTLVFLENINENVTLTKNIIIDGNQKNYTGTMNIGTVETVTVQNVNFVKGCIDGNTSAQSRKLTITNCTFDGVDNSIVYAITQRHGVSISIENSSAKNYKYGMLYIPQSVVSITVKNVAVENGQAAFNISYSGDGTFENVTLNNVAYGLHAQNHGARTFTVKGWSITNVDYPFYVQTKGTATVTFALEGQYDIKAYQALYAKFVLANETSSLASTISTFANETVVSGVEGKGVIYKDGKYIVGDYVAQIGETKYIALSKALEAATAGETIVFLADITEDATISKAVTIDGADKTYTGKMTLTADATIKNVNFDGKGYNGYAIETRGADYLTVEDCTAKNYGYGFVQLASGTALTTVKNVTVSNMNYGVKVDYSNKVVLENVDITAGVAALLNSNYGEKTITIKDSKLNILGTWVRNNTIKTTYVFEGANTVGQWIIDAAIDNFKLATVESTLTAPNSVEVTTDLAGYTVKYAEGKYFVAPMMVHTLAKGWNWFSSYININGEDGFEKLQKALGTSGLHIKNQHQFVDYNEGWDWNGTLESTSVEEMYMIQTSEQVELVLEGNIVNPAETEITLQNGWTYIGYPVATAMNIKDALVDINPQDGDIIKTHNGVAMYYKDLETESGQLWSGWDGSLQSMTPGMGYMYRNTSGSVKEFTYPTPNANTRAAVKANVTAENNRWVPNASAFASNMNIIAVLESNDMMGEFEVAAFVNGEVRGSARPTYVEPIDAYVLFMTIYGEEGEEMTFKYYDIYSDEEHVISNTVAYSDNAVIGSIKEPYMFFANTLGMEENAASALSIYPNPTTTNAAISFDTVYDMVEVFNALGSKVAEYSNVDRIEGMEAAGVYVIRVTNDNAVQNCRLIVK